MLARLADGLTNREVAAQLGISPNTVQTHRTRFMRKLGLNSRLELLRYALRAGLGNDTTP